jgi:TatA/E family protein of Tat protein translocase
MFGSIGGPELLIIFVIALIVFGPRRLPEIGKSLGKMIGEFRRASNDLKRTIEDEVEADRLRQLASVPYSDLSASTSAAPAAAQVTVEGGDPLSAPANAGAASSDRPAPPATEDAPIASEPHQLP